MTTQFGILDNTEVIYLSKIKNQGGIAVESQEGGRLPAHATALGKAMLSLLPDKILRANYANLKFDKFTPNTISSFSELYDRLKEIRYKKFAEDYEEFTKGVFCISVPVPGIRTNTIGAISTSMPEEHWKKVDREKIVEKLNLAGKRILEDVKVYYGSKSFKQ